MHIKLKRTPAIYLVGFTGAGKSVIGQLLADQLGWDFVNIETEAEALPDWVRRVERGLPMVLSLSSVSFVEPGDFDLIKNHGITVWIACPLEAVERRAGYQRADFRIDGEGEAQTAVDAILALPIWR